MKKHSIVLSGHQTSFSLEDEFWDALKQIAVKKNVSVSSLITEIDNQRTQNLSSAIRLFVLKEYQNANI